MIDQSHNVTDPIESLIQSSNEIITAYVKSILVDQKILAELQKKNDIIGANLLLKEAFNTDVSGLIKKKFDGSSDTFCSNCIKYSF